MGTAQAREVSESPFEGVPALASIQRRCALVVLGLVLLLGGDVVEKTVGETQQKRVLLVRAELRHHTAPDPFSLKSAELTGQRDQGKRADLVDADLTVVGIPGWGKQKSHEKRPQFGTQSEKGTGNRQFGSLSRQAPSANSWLEAGTSVLGDAVVRTANDRSAEKGVRCRAHDLAILVLPPGTAQGGTIHATLNRRSFQ